MNPNPSDLRAQTFRALTEGPLDVLVIGGGIVGSGIARDAALRGLRVGLVEQHDFASGTSSRSSRLLHGGLRYLAQGRIGLVHEASVEKKVIHHIAPHLAEPLPFIFPTYRDHPDWVLWELKIGVKVYDLLCGGRNLGRSTWLGRDEVAAKVPGLKPEGLTGAVRYYDGFTNDARLTLDTLRSAVRGGALVLNYCRFENARRDEGGVSSSRSADIPVRSKPREGAGLDRSPDSLTHRTLLRTGMSALRVPKADRMSALRPPEEGQFWECDLRDLLGGPAQAVQARAVVNAAGPWADGLPHSRVKLRVTKGVHLVVERARLPVPETVVMTEGKRILFAIPWGERTILGTTDTDYEGPLDDVRATDDDIRYVLDITNQFFPQAKLGAADVISFWAGLRPLVADPTGKPSDISRSHEIHSPEPGWWDVAGGKLTTYRLMGEQTVDRILKSLSASPSWKREVRPCRTAEERLLPDAEVAGVSGILPPECSRGTVEHYVAHEWAVHLEDIMLRRTSWHYYFSDAPRLAQRVADWMGELLGWPAATRAEELARYARATGRQKETSPVRGAAAMSV